MSSDLKHACRPFCGLVTDAIEDLVMDHPWGWTGFAFFVGVLLGRKKTSCREKSSS